MTDLSVLVIGQPNVGKSCLMNTLIGPRVVVSNYPGTTVETTRGEKVIGDTKISFMDTPGIYSISDRSEEEKVTEEALFEGTPDAVIILADSTFLERSLYLVLQVLEAGVPAVVALNFVEEAEKRGILIDHRKLSKILGIRVLPINPLTGGGTDRLLGALANVVKEQSEPFTVRYEDEIEREVERISSRVKDARLPERFIALRVLEGDADFFRYENGRSRPEATPGESGRRQEISEQISLTRYGTAAFIAEKVTRTARIPHGRATPGDRVDRVLLHAAWGPFLTILSFIGVFGVLLLLGRWMQDILMRLTDEALAGIQTGGGLLGGALAAGLTGLAAGLSIAFPYVFLFYLFLGLAEDIGVLSRFIVNLERFSKQFNLPGKMFVPLLLGLGCTVPAVRSTRILGSQKEKLWTASFFTSVPCSSRLAVIMGVVGYFGGTLLAASVFAALLVSFVIWGYLVKIVSRMKKTPLLLELPPYRRPLARNIATKSWIRMRDFVFVVMPLLVAGGAVYWILESLGFSQAIVSPLSPVTRWLGLPAVMIIPLVFGFLQKDLTAAMLLAVFGGAAGVSALPPLDLFTFGLAATIGIPCVIALGMLVMELGLRKAVVLTAASIGYGLLFAGLARRIISIFW